MEDRHTGKREARKRSGQAKHGKVWAWLIGSWAWRFGFGEQWNVLGKKCYVGLWEGGSASEGHINDFFLP